MSLFDNFKNFFNKKNIDDEALVSYQEIDENLIAVEPPLVLPIPHPFPLEGSSPPLAQIPAVTLPEKSPYSWIENEDLLRDEGVIFGLSNVNPEEKTAAIQSYFSHQTADLEKDVEQLNEKIQELNLFIEQRQTRIDEAQTKAKILENRQHDSQHELPRTIVGLVFSLAMCVGNYFLISDTIRPLYPNGQWIAMGVFLAGMFNLFGRISLFHETEVNLSWRNVLEEIGMPLAAATFVATQAIQNQSLGRTLALFGFVFFLFMFAGKLMLSTLTVLRRDLQAWFVGMSLRNEQQTKSVVYEQEIENLEIEIDNFRIQKWQIVPNLNKAEGELARLNARRDMLIKIFESEFNLARQLKDRLSDKQLKRIVSEL